MIKKIAVSLLFTLILAAKAWCFFSGNTKGTAAAQFLKMGAGARAAAMGGAYTAVNGNSDMIYYNPAGLAVADQKEVSFMHSIWLEDISYNWLAFVMPHESYGVFGAALQYVTYGQLDGRDNFGNETSTFSPQDIAAYVSYANYYNKLSYGVNIKFIQSQIIETANTFAVDLGAQYELNNKTYFGFLMQNLGPGLKYNYNSDPLPMLIALGALYSLTNELLFTLDLKIPSDNDPYPALGAQYFIDASEDISIFIRAGYDGNRSDINGFTSINLGFGLDYKTLSFNYAFAPYGDIGSTHKIALSLRFGEIL